jgi:hypothetical protein
MPSDKPLRSWGVAYNSGIVYSRGYECLYCGWELYSASLVAGGIVRHLIGFSTDLRSLPKTTKGDVVGIAILECPQCSEKFCFHASKDYINLAIERCPHWPKD